MKILLLFAIFTLAAASPTARRVKRADAQEDSDLTHKKLSGIVNQLREVAEDLEVRNQEERTVDEDVNLKVGDDDLEEVFANAGLEEKVRELEELEERDDIDAGLYAQARAYADAKNARDGGYDQEVRKIPAPGRGPGDWMPDLQQPAESSEEYLANPDPYGYERESRMIPAPGRGHHKLPRYDDRDDAYSEEGAFGFNPMSNEEDRYGNERGNRMIPAPGRGPEKLPWYDRDEEVEFKDEVDSDEDENFGYDREHRMIPAPGRGPNQLPWYDAEREAGDADVLPDDDYLEMEGRSADADEKSDKKGSWSRSKCSGCSVSCGQGEGEDDRTCSCESCCFCRCQLSHKSGYFWKPKNWEIKAVCK